MSGAAVMSAPPVQGLVYDEPTRAHSLNGRPIPSVTQVIKCAGLSDDFRFVDTMVLERARDIGKATHAATHYYDEGDLDESTIAPEVLPRLEAWKRLREEHGLVPMLLETVVCSTVFHFIGRFDRLMRTGWGPAKTILLDIKCGDPDSASANLQLSGYEVALREEHPELANEVIHRWSAELCDDGRYKLRQYPRPGRTNRQDRAEFLAAVTVVNARTAREGRPVWI